jgi:arylsulfatase A-like enzyme
MDLLGEGTGDLAAKRHKKRERGAVVWCFCVGMVATVVFGLIGLTFGLLEPRDNMRKLDFIPIAAWLIGSALTAAETNAATKPNILVIITDQQRADMLSCAGNRYLKTPALDSLAAMGTRFEEAYCANPVCVPSRTSMLTGMMPSRIGMETNEDLQKAQVSADMLANALGRVFARAGYETVYGGKQHVPMTIEAAGFKDIENDQGPRLAETCASFLRHPHAQPFLMVASFINPHDICYMALSDAAHPGKIDGPSPLLKALALPEGVSRADFPAKVCPPLPTNYGIPDGEPEALLSADMRAFRTKARYSWIDEQWRMHRWAYARLTELADGQIGVVLKALRETGLEKNTLVVFVSDHGDMDASHHLEHKSVLYDEASRVPFIVSWQGVTRPGLVDREHLASTGLDLIPTICDFAGIQSPPGLPGRSVRALAEGRDSASWRETLVVENGNSRMLRTAQYKYVVYGSGARREVLTNMVADPGEMKNLAPDLSFASVLEAHRRLLKEWYQHNGGSLDPKYTVSGK